MVSNIFSKQMQNYFKRTIVFSFTAYKIMAAFKTVVLSSLKTLSLWWMLFKNRLSKLYHHVSDIKTTQRVGRLKTHIFFNCIF